MGWEAGISSRRGAGGHQEEGLGPESQCREEGRGRAQGAPPVGSRVPWPSGSCPRNAPCWAGQVQSLTAAALVGGTLFTGWNSPARSGRYAPPSTDCL